DRERVAPLAVVGRKPRLAPLPDALHVQPGGALLLRIGAGAPGGHLELAQALALRARGRVRPQLAGTHPRRGGARVRRRGLAHVRVELALGGDARLGFAAQLLRLLLRGGLLGGGLLLVLVGAVLHAGDARGRIRRLAAAVAVHDLAVRALALEELRGGIARRDRCRERREREPAGVRLRGVIHRRVPPPEKALR